MERERKSTLVKAQEKKSGTDSSRGAIRKDVKALLSPIDSSPERTSVRSIRRQERRALRDPNYARNRLISTLANTDPEDLFSSGAPGDLLDDDLQSEAGPPVSPTPLIRRTRSSRKPRQRPKMSEGSGAAERFAASSADESAHSDPPTQRVREQNRRTTCADEIASAAANIEDDREALKRVSREILEGVERLGAVKVKEYVIPRTAKATVLVERVLERMTQLEEENRDLRRALGRLNKIEGAVQDLQRAMGRLDKIEEAAKDLQRTARRPVVQVQQPRQDRVSYADTVKRAIQAAPAQPRRSERTVVISAPEGVPPEDIQGKLQAAVDPVQEGWQIVRHRVTKSAKLALSAATEEQAKALVAHPKIREAGLHAEILGRRRPRMVVYDLPADKPDEEVLDTIMSQNFPDLPENNTVRKELSPVHKFSTTRTAKGKRHWVCEVSPALRKVLMDRKRLYVDFSSCRVDDHLGVTRCYRCQGFGHTAKRCRQKETCSHCATEGHQRRDCPRLQDPPRCAVCARFRKDAGHDTRDNSCPALKAEIESLTMRTDYG